MGLITPSGRAGEKVHPGRPINIIVPYGQGGKADLGRKAAAHKKAEF